MQIASTLPNMTTWTCLPSLLGLKQRHNPIRPAPHTGARRAVKSFQQSYFDKNFSQTNALYPPSPVFHQSFSNNYTLTSHLLVEAEKHHKGPLVPCRWPENKQKFSLATRTPASTYYLALQTLLKTIPQQDLICHA